MIWIIQELLTGYDKYGNELTSTMMYTRIKGLIILAVVGLSIIAGIVLGIIFGTRAHKRRKQGRGK